MTEPAKPKAPERSTGPKLLLQQLPTETRGSLLEVCSHTLIGLQQRAGGAEGQHVGRLLPRGLQNSGNLCFMNATLQVGSHSEQSGRSRQACPPIAYQAAPDGLSHLTEQCLPAPAA